MLQSNNLGIRTVDLIVTKCAGIRNTVEIMAEGAKVWITQKEEEKKANEKHYQEKWDTNNE